jgi:large subunit ribosomal protein L25
VVEVEALPKDLPDELVLDITSLAEIGDKLMASDLVIPSGVTMITEPDILIVSVEETKAQISEEEEAAEAAEGEEGAEGEPTEGETEGDQPTEKPAE